MPPPERGLDFFESCEIFLEPVDMLLHLHDGRSEFLYRAESSTHPWHLRLSRLLPYRPTHEPEHEHPAEQTDPYETT